MGQLIANLMITIRKYGIQIIVLWSLILGIQNFMTLLVQTQSLQGLGTIEPSGWVTLYFIVSVGFSLAFFAAAIGLWRLKTWGRQLFFSTAVAFFLLSLIGIFTLQQDYIDLTQKWLFAIRYIISTLLPIIYLNMDDIKAKFQDTQKGFTS